MKHGRNRVESNGLSSTIPIAHGQPFAFINGHICRRIAGESLLPILSGQVSRAVDRYPQRDGHFSFSRTSDRARVRRCFSSGELVAESFVLRPPTILPASSVCLTFASINKGRRSKCGAGRLSSESLRVVLRFPLEANTRNQLRVSVHTILGGRMCEW